MIRFQTYLPDERLKAYVKAFIISENPDAGTFKVLPKPGMVVGFQYSGALSLVKGPEETSLSNSGITGFTDKFRIYRNTAGIGTVLVYFTETGVSNFTDCPAGHLFSESVSLDNLFNRNKVDEVTDRLFFAQTDRERITIVEQFLLSELRPRDNHSLLNEAVRQIYRTKGAIQISKLGKQLYTSASVLERRFKSQVGVTPKKFASIVRFNHILEELKSNTPLLDICYQNNYFDQAHFIKDFKNFTGASPEEFRRFL